MKDRRLFVLSLLLAVPLFADERSDPGTLLLSDGRLLFHGSGPVDHYNLTEVPGIEVLSYEKKVVTKDNTELDASEMTVTFGSGQTVKFVGRQPQHVIRTTDDNGIHWKLTEPPDPSDPLQREVASGFFYNSFDEAVDVIEQRTGFRVTCQPDLADFMRKQWIKVSEGIETTLDGDTLRAVPPKDGTVPQPTITTRRFLDSIARRLNLRWDYDPASKTVSLRLPWITTDSRTPVELLHALINFGYSTDYEKDQNWQHVFNALLSAPTNLEKAWPVRQQGISETWYHSGLEYAVAPTFVKPVISTSMAKYTLILIEHSINTYPGHGSLSYYWFQEDGTLAGAGIINTGWRCKLVDGTVDNEYGSRSDQPSEIHLILKWNTRDFLVARFQLTPDGLQLVSLVDAAGKTFSNQGVNVGDSLLK